MGSAMQTSPTKADLTTATAEGLVCQDQHCPTGVPFPGKSRGQSATCLGRLMALPTSITQETMLCSQWNRHSLWTWIYPPSRQASPRLPRADSGCLTYCQGVRGSAQHCLLPRATGQVRAALRLFS